MIKSLIWIKGCSLMKSLDWETVSSLMKLLVWETGSSLIKSPDWETVSSLMKSLVWETGSSLRLQVGTDALWEMLF